MREHLRVSSEASVGEVSICTVYGHAHNGYTGGSCCIGSAFVRESSMKREGLAILEGLLVRTFRRAQLSHCKEETRD